jgi:hypothetical protein
MRKVIVLGLVAALGVLSISAVAFAGRGHGKGNGNATSFSAKMNGWEEDPSQVTTGTGSFRATVVSPTQIDFRVTFRNLEATNILFSHIHIGSRHESGAVSAFLCGGTTQPACPAGPTGSFSGSILADDIVASGAGQGVEPGNFADLLRAMRKGESYANLHTSPRAPGGEIRGQIKARHHDDDDDD